MTNRTPLQQAALEARMADMQPAIEHAAHRVALALIEQDTVSFDLVPGDATLYPLIIRKPGPVATNPGPRNDGTLHHDEYLVVLGASFGGSYPWAGQQMHWDYCAQKWTPNGHEWTGRVMAAFLTALAGQPGVTDRVGRR